MNDPEFQPGASVSSGDAGHEPEAGPFSMMSSIDSASETYEWDVRECARIDLRVTITSDGSITIEWELCRNCLRSPSDSPTIAVDSDDRSTGTVTQYCEHALVKRVSLR